MMMMMMMMIESFIASELIQNYTSLLSRKKFYKYKFTSLTKEFEDLKIEFSKLVESKEKLANDLKSSNSLENQLKKANDENLKLFQRSVRVKEFYF